MAVPQVRTSRRKRGMRRSHHALKVPTMVTCNNCSALITPHKVCPQCGHFKGREILSIENY